LFKEIVRQAIDQVLKGGDGYVATLKVDDGSWVQVLFDPPGWVLSFSPKAERIGEVRAGSFESVDR